jgi:hypothetical protein
MKVGASVEQPSVIEGPSGNMVVIPKWSVKSGPDGLRIYMDTIIYAAK